MIHKNKLIIAVDPSGNFDNGKGGTGIAALTETNGKIRGIITHTIWAKDFENKQLYYAKIIFTIKNLCGKAGPNQKPLIVVEDFKLQGGKAAAQTNQSMETSELIGAIDNYFSRTRYPVVKQLNTVKARWKRKQQITDWLQRWDLTIYTPNSTHAWDALRHLFTAYFWTYDKVFKNKA